MKVLDEKRRLIVSLDKELIELRSKIILGATPPVNNRPFIDQLLLINDELTKLMDEVFLATGAIYSRTLRRWIVRHPP